MTAVDTSAWPLGLTDKQIAGLEMLRREVPEQLIGKLPKVTCRDCSKGSCQQHSKVECSVCKAFISSKHIHLDFVGHAETTSQFLEADLTWNWEPMGFDTHGLPAFDDIGGLWIRLTICGVTRIGYGTADNANGFKSKGDIRKEIIGDALRNAGMRFGHALNLWAKTDIHDRQEQEQREPAPAPRPQLPPFAVQDDLRRLSVLLNQKLGSMSGEQQVAKVAGFIHRSIWSLAQVFAPECAAMVRSLEEMPDYQEPGEQSREQPSAEDPATVADRIEVELLERIRQCTTSGELGSVLDRADAEQQAGRIGQVHVSVLAAAVDKRLAELAGAPQQATAVSDLTGAAQ